jgi:DNA-binding CsgD family transcriptional regulator
MSSSSIHIIPIQSSLHPLCSLSIQSVPLLRYIIYVTRIIPTAAIHPLFWTNAVPNLNETPLGIETWETLAGTLSSLEKALKQLGIKAGAYFMTAPFHSQVSITSAVFHFGFPEPAMREWLESNTFANDPVPDFVANAGEVMTWTEIVAKVKIPKEQRHFMKLLLGHGLRDSIVVPLFGPNQRDSVAVCMFDAMLGNKHDDLISEIVITLRRAHYKICLLVIRDHSRKIKLSKRESEVLHWIARGKSNPDIATILGISAETIDTYVRRLYPKLGVHDRVTAVAEGIARGLVLL